jgi:cytochrome d ubiquinol oxidase subunit I
MPDLIGQWLNDFPKTDLRLLSMFGIGVHWWILQYTIGLSLTAVLFELWYLLKRDEKFKEMAKTFSKAVAIAFAVGAGTGTLSEFGLVLLWPNLIVLVGKYFFYPLYLEIFAFIAETVFVYMYFYSWDKVKEWFHLFIGVLATFGAFLSALLIIAVNTLMQMPPGLIPTYDPTTGIWSEPRFNLYLPDGSSAVLSSSQVRDVMLNNPETFNAILFATVKKIGVIGIVLYLPGVIPSFLHGLIAAILVSQYTILGAYAWWYLKTDDENRKNYYLDGLKFVSFLTLVFIALQGLVGDLLGKIVAKYNPEKLAAIEGTSETIISIPRLMGLEWLVKILTYGDPNAKLPNYDTIPIDWRPPLFIHYVYYTKIGLAILLGLNSLILVLFWFVLKREIPKFLIKLNVLTPFIAHIVSTFGWGVREVGRKPWTVYGLLKVDEAATPMALSPLLTLGIIIYIFAVGFGLLYVVYRVFVKR